jgi:hypothetical protein
MTQHEPGTPDWLVRVRCRLLGHKFGGWPIHSPGPLPLTFCARCGKEF